MGVQTELVQDPKGDQGPPGPQGPPGEPGRNASGQLDYSADPEFHKWLTGSTTMGGASDFKSWLATYNPGTSLYCLDGNCVVPSKNDTALIQPNVNTAKLNFKNVSSISSHPSNIMQLISTNGTSMSLKGSDIELNKPLILSGTDQSITAGLIKSGTGGFLTLKSGAGPSQIQLKGNGVDINSTVTMPADSSLKIGQWEITTTDNDFIIKKNSGVGSGTKSWLFAGDKQWRTT